MTSFYTVIIRPIPRGIGRDDLVANHLLPFGQIKDIRFGNGRGVSGDIMYVDYFDLQSAAAAVKGLNGVRDPGTSHLLLSVTLSKSTSDALALAEREIAKSSAPKRLSLVPETDDTDQAPHRAETEWKPRMIGSLKCLRSRDTGKEICVLDLRKRS
jgi:hypothetical protein